MRVVPQGARILPASNRKNGFRILSLSGGGFLGLYSAAVLAELEARAGEPLGRRFDLIAGTSVGGILAIALAYEIPMALVLSLIAARGTSVFSPRPLPTGTVGRLIDATRGMFGPKYDPQPLRDAMAELLAERRLGEAEHNVVVPAVDLTRGVTKVFKTPHAAGSTGDEHVAAVDAAMATSAAPAYFPAVPIGDSLYADGGLFATAPDLVALHEAEHYFGARPDAIRVLSIGTGVRGYRPSGAPEAAIGSMGWMTEGRLVMTVLAVQQQHIDAVMRDRLGRRYLRLDADWPGEGGLALDVATPAAARKLQDMAAGTLAATPATALAPFLSAGGRARDRSPARAGS